jgi:hypothetical protein
MKLNKFVQVWKLCESAQLFGIPDARLDLEVSVNFTDLNND